MEFIIDRANNSAGMYLQTGTMAEAFVIGDSIKYINDLTTFYLTNELLAQEEDYLLMTLEYGTFTSSDVFAIKRLPQ